MIMKRLSKIEKLLKDKLIFAKTIKYPTTGNIYITETFYGIKKTNYKISIRENGTPYYYLYDKSSEVIPIKVAKNQKDFIEILKKVLNDK